MADNEKITDSMSQAHPVSTNCQAKVDGSEGPGAPEERTPHSGADTATRFALIDINIDELELALECIGDGDSHYDDAPLACFLRLTNSEIVWAESEDEADELSEDPDLLEIPQGLYEGWDHNVLPRFVASLPESPLQARLEKAICGRGAFRRFKDILFGESNIELQYQWNWFETRNKRERIVEWLESCQIEPNWNRDIFEAPALPEKRHELLSAVRDFVVEARELSGVQRISLLGSLTTSKAIPKDVDLLVEVTDDMPLSKLARLKRQLLGKTMQTGDGCGADVFLCNPQREYLGRICSWKKCDPELMRQSCPAQNCARRKFLNDDLQSVCLDSSLLTEPPLELWPDLVARMDPPQDVHEQLLDKLR